MGRVGQPFTFSYLVHLQRTDKAKEDIVSTEAQNWLTEVGAVTNMVHDLLYAVMIVGNIPSAEGDTHRHHITVERSGDYAKAEIWRIR